MLRDPCEGELFKEMKAKKWLFFIFKIYLFMRSLGITPLRCVIPERGSYSKK
jgi:hypothetical protein